MKRVLFMTGIVIILALIAGMLYLMHAEAGLQWLITKATHSVPGLSITSAQGRLSGPMKIKGIQYRTQESSFGIDEFALDWRPSRLILLQAHISYLNAEGVKIGVAPQTEEAEPPSDLPEISIPLKIVLEKAVINNISIMHSGERNPVHIQTVSIKGRMGSTGIRMNQLDIIMPELILSAEGNISPLGDYPMRIATSWTVRVPKYAEISGQGEIAGTLKLLKLDQEVTSPFHSNVRMEINDVIKSLSWEGNLTVRDFNTVKLNKTWPDVTLSGTVSGHGSGSTAHISSLNVRVLDGIVTGNGSVNWQPDITWSFNMNTENLNPGIQWPDWQGSLNMTAGSSGHYEKGSLMVKPSEVVVEGRLRDRMLKAQALMSMMDSQLEVTGLDISSGESQLSVSGNVADTWSLKWKAHIRDAGDLMPILKGVIEGNGSVTGSRSYPLIKGNMNARAVSYDTYGAESITAVLDIDTKDERESLLNFRAANVLINGQKIKTVSLKSKGLVTAHSISMNASMDRESMALMLTGGYKDEAWAGRFDGAVLDAGKFGTWSLKKPASFSISKERAGSELLCVAREDTDLCFQTSWDRANGIKGGFSLTDFPLSIMRAFLPSSVETEGVLSGSGNVVYSQDGTMSGNVSLMIPSGKFYYQVDAERVDVPLGKSHVDIMLNEKALDAHTEITFPDRGHVKGEISLPGFMQGISTMADQNITGRVSAEIHNLDLIPVFVERVNKASGAADAIIRIHGTLSEMTISGDMNLKGGEAHIPDLGVTLKDINLALNGDESGTFTIKGRLSSGSGHAAIDGTVRLHTEKAPSAVLHIQGEDVEAVKIPGTWIIVSPDVDVRVEDKTIHFAGSLNIPKARVEPPDVSGAVLPSKDVIVVDMPVRKKEAGWSVQGKLKLSLGDNVRFSGYGLTCRVSGGIHLTEQPGTVTQGQGELQIVEGKYRAYGQDLTIEKGRIIFAGLIDDPGLDIRAFRKIKDVTAGASVQGTLKIPRLAVYSVPSMDESDALSYVLFGRPMKQLSGSEGNQLYGAALSAGLSAGGFVAKKIGAAFGVEDIEIEKGEAPGQATLFIGKYLSPRLYVHYGIGLFEPVSIIRLRYDLTRRLQVQTEHGLESGGDVLYTIER